MKTPAHSLLGASGAYRWLNCPGSFQLSLTAPSRPSSIYAATGTVAHTLIERMLRASVKNGLSPGAVPLPATAGEPVLCEGHTIVIDQDFIDGINVMLGYVNEAAMDSDWCNVEFKVELDSYFPEPPPVSLFGRVDVALLDLQTETLEVIDYKNGSGVIISPIENPQLLYYAAGVLRALPDNQRRQVRRIKVTIVQPHAPGMNPIRSWETTAIDLLMWVDDVLVPGVNACGEDDPPLNPGSWCRFCPALHACPRLMKDAVEMAKREFDDATLPDDPTDLAKALDIAERALTWAQALQAHALEQLQRQVRIPGWEMVPTRPTRKWIDEESTTASVLATLGVKDEVIWETKLRSPAQMEKALIKNVWGRQVWRDQIADNLIESRSSGVKLARSQRADAKGEFEDVD